MEKVNNVLADRGAVYGSYNKGVKFRADMMEQMEEMKLFATGVKYTEPERVLLNDIMMKIRRLGVSPLHKDSWIDIAGYATLIVDFIDGNEICEDKSGGLFNEQH